MRSEDRDVGRRDLLGKCDDVLGAGAATVNGNEGTCRRLERRSALAHRWRREGALSHPVSPWLFSFKFWSATQPIASPTHDRIARKGSLVTGAPSSINGIHHLTAVSRDAQRTVDFYTGLLGLRLIKQTVNFDDPSSYHLYFADEENGPGVLTFFEWKSASRGRYGIGGTHHLAFETQDRDTLLQWKRWLTDSGIPARSLQPGLLREHLLHRSGRLDPRDRDARARLDARRGSQALGSQVKLPPRETTVNHRDEAAIAAATWPIRFQVPRGRCAVGCTISPRLALTWDRSNSSSSVSGHATGETDGQLRRSELAASLFRRR